MRLYLKLKGNFNLNGDLWKITFVLKIIVETFIL